MTNIRRALWLSLLLLCLTAVTWAQLPVADDSYITSTNPTTNSGNSPSLVLQQATNGTALIRPDITQLTAAGVTSGQISKAYLKVYATAVTGQGTFDLYQITSSWQEGTVTYNNKPSMTLVTSGTACPSGVQCINAASKFYQFDITSLVQGWVNNPATNFGLALKPNGTTLSVTLESKESTTTSHAPEIDVVLNTNLAQIPGSIPESQVTNLVTDLGNLNINVASRLLASEKGAANGVATLDPTTRVPRAQLPSALVYNDQTNTFGVGLKQIFQSNGTAGLNIAPAASNLNPSSPVAGDFWFRADLKHLHFFDGTAIRQLMYADDPFNGNVNGSQVIGNISGNAANVTGIVAVANGGTGANTSGQALTNLGAASNTALAAETTRAQGAEATLQGNISAEAAARAGEDVILGSAIASETSRATAAEGTLTTNLNSEISRAQGAEATKADLITPVQLDNTAVLHNTCATVNAMVLNSNQSSGQQLFICRDVGSNVLQWELINDDSATTSAANAYTDQQVAAEAAARQAADASEATARQQGDANTLSAANAHADAGDATTLSSANTFASTAVAAEAVLRAAGDASTLASANSYTDGQIATVNTTVTGKADKSGGNNFTGNQSITGNLSVTGNSTINGLLNLPASAAGPSQPSNALRFDATDNSSASQSAQLLALADGSLNFQFGPTSGPISSKLTVAPTGIITFALGQTFPGTTNGTVTQIDTGAGLTGGPITSTGTIALAPSGIAAGTYTKLTVDQYGRATLGAGLSATDIPTISESQVNNLVTDLSLLSANIATKATAVSITGATNTKITYNSQGIVTAGSQAASTDLSDAANLAYNNQANIFLGGKQTLAASLQGAQGYASLNFPDSGTTPTTPVAGDMWLTNGNPHLQFFDGSTTRSLAFTTDVNAGTVTNVTASSPLNSSGGATPNISLTGIVPVANGGTGANTAGGALSNLGGASAVPGAGGSATLITFNTQGVVTGGATASAGNLSNGTSGSGAIVLVTSPALAGTPTAPTAASGTNSTQIATTAFVQTAVGATSGATFIKDSSNGALPNKQTAWIGNDSSGDGSTAELNFEFLMGETVTYAKFFCRVSAALPSNVTFQVFDSNGVAVAGGNCLITAGNTSGNATSNTIALSAGNLYAVKASLAAGTFGGGAPNGWWALGQ